MDTKCGKRVCQIASPPNSSGVREIYFFGIIDCFTPYNWKKVVAHTAKKSMWNEVIYYDYFYYCDNYYYDYYYYYYYSNDYYY